MSLVMFNRLAVLLTATAFATGARSAHADDFLSPMFDGRQARVEAIAELSSSEFPARSKIVVHLRNPSTFPLCIPAAFLPENGRLTNRSVEVFDDQGRPAKYIGVSNFIAPPFDRLLAIPIGYTADIDYFLGDSFQIEAGRRYRVQIKIDAFDCTALAKGYVFPQWRPASEWKAEYEVPAVDLDSKQMFTFEAETWFIAD